MSGKIATWEFMKNNFWEVHLNDNVPQTKQCVSYEKLLDNYNVEEISGKSLKQLVREDEIVSGVKYSRFLNINRIYTISLWTILLTPEFSYRLYVRGNFNRTDILYSFIKQLNHLIDDRIECVITINEANYNTNKYNEEWFTKRRIFNVLKLVKNNPDTLFDFLEYTDIYSDFDISNINDGTKYYIIDFNLLNMTPEILNDLKTKYLSKKDTNIMFGIFNHFPDTFYQAFYKLNSHIENQAQFEYIDYKNKSPLNTISNSNKHNGVSRYISLNKFNSINNDNIINLDTHWCIEEKKVNSTDINNGKLIFVSNNGLSLNNIELSFPNITDNKFYEFLRITSFDKYIYDTNSNKHYNAQIFQDSITYSNLEWYDTLHKRAKYLANTNYNKIPLISDCYSFYVTKNNNKYEIWVLYTYFDKKYYRINLQQRLIYSFPISEVKKIKNILLVINKDDFKKVKLHFSDINISEYIDISTSPNPITAVLTGKTNFFEHNNKLNADVYLEMENISKGRGNKFICSIFPVSTSPTTNTNTFYIGDVMNYLKHSINLE